MKKLSVIIVAYNSADKLKNCLDSIRKYNDLGEALEVIVSDNSPSLDVEEMIKREYTDVLYLHNENKGFGAGNNRGFEIANGEYLLFLNPDTVLVESVFSFAVEKFEKDERLGLFGVQLIKENGERNASYFYIDKYGPFSEAYLHCCWKSGRFVDGKMFICGADLFVRRKAFEEAGLFDENIFLYMEEPDLILRIKSNGYKTAFFKEKKIIHLEGGTQEKSDEQTILQYSRILDSDIYFASKHSRNLLAIWKGKKNFLRAKKLVCFLKGDKGGRALQKRLIALVEEYIARYKEEKRRER